MGNQSTYEIGILNNLAKIRAEESNQHFRHAGSPRLVKRTDIKPTPAIASDEDLRRAMVEWSEEKDDLANQPAMIGDRMKAPKSEQTEIGH